MSTDDEWAFVAPYLTRMTEDTPQREQSVREMFNGRRWMVRASAARLAFCGLCHFATEAFCRTLGLKCITPSRELFRQSYERLYGMNCMPLEPRALCP